MRVFTCNDFTGHYPVGSAAVVIAKDEHHAEEILRLSLGERGLSGDFTLKELNVTEAGAVILADGNY